MTPIQRLILQRNAFGFLMLSIAALCFGYAEIEYTIDRDRMICVDQLFDTHNALAACENDRAYFEEARDEERQEHLHCEDHVDELLYDNGACPNPYDFCRDDLDQLYSYCVQGQLSPHMEDLYRNQLIACEQRLSERTNLEACLSYIRELD